ncbi:MAG: bacterial Ig-like domain-containing protein [Clostridia bacterium]|nr:bacterial Ig-like domain-containing protein [Clostridia bacterium]
MKKLISVFMAIVFVLTALPVLAINSVATEATAPVFSVTQESATSGLLILSFNLESGSFNSLDLKFDISDGLKCLKIQKSEACSDGGFVSTNPEATDDAYNFSMVSTSGYSEKGSLFTATFEITRNNLESYSVAFNIEDCTVTSTDNGVENISVKPVNPIFSKRSLSISVASLPKKTTYCIGQSLDTTGLSVKAEYFNGESKTITNYKTSYNFSSAGTKTVKITYSESSLNAETSFDVTVNNHNPGELKVVKNPTCTADGLKEQHCTVCGAMLHSEAIKATGHSFETVLIKRPTYKTTGESKKTCTKCSYVAEVITAPKCNADIDGNGSVSSRDALFILQHATGLKALTGSALTNADLDGSGDIKSNDALVVLQLATGLIKA